MANFNIKEAQKHLSTLIARAMDGEEIVITKDGRPAARLLPIREKYVAPRVPGIDKGKVVIKPEFDEPLQESER